MLTALSPKSQTKSYHGSICAMSATLRPSIMCGNSCKKLKVTYYGLQGGNAGRMRIVSIEVNVGMEDRGRGSRGRELKSGWGVLKKCRRQSGRLWLRSAQVEFSL